MPASPESTPPRTLTELFLGFLSIGARSFGGVLPWAHRAMVEERLATDWSPLDGGGFGSLPPGPGLGITVDESRLGAPVMTFGAKTR